MWGHRPISQTGKLSLGMGQGYAQVKHSTSRHQDWLAIFPPALPPIPFPSSATQRLRTSLTTLGHWWNERGSTNPGYLNRRSQSKVVLTV